LNAAPASDATDATLNVVVSKGGKECPASSAVTVAVADLQEMQNGMRETVDQGLQELQSNQGKNGIPAAPRSAMAPTVQTAFAQAAPPAEVNGAAAVNMELTAAEQVDTEAAQGSAIGALNSPLAAPSAATVNIEVGQTIAEVTSSLGQPVSIIDLGVKKVYKYKDLKVTFKSGKVADVE